MTWEFKEISIGDVVRINMGNYYHFGICTDNNRIIQFGKPVINANPNEVEVCSTDFDSFLCGKFAEVMVLNKKELKKANDVKTIIKNAENSLGEKGYNILHNNCEHFVNRCVFNKSFSGQVSDVETQIFNKITPKDVYVAKVSAFENNTCLPNFTLKELKKITHQGLTKQKIAVYGLLKYAIKKSLNIDEDFSKLKKTKNGKPVSDDYFFSISHTDDLVAVAVSKCAVGVDLEFVEPSKNFELLKRAVLAPEETFEINSVKDFVELWTKKEAFFKLNDGKHFKPKEINTKDFNSKTFDILENDKTYILSLVSSDVDNVNLYKI